MHVRVAPEAVARCLTAGLLACCCLAIACGRDARAVNGTWTTEPAPPVTGVATLVRLALQNERGRPLGGATLVLEAHMPHPGMAPITAAMQEREAGAYEARIQLSMAGPWVLVAAGALADGSRITSEYKTAAVQPSGEPPR